MPEISCTLCCFPSTFPVLLWFRIDTYDAFRSTDFWKYADQMFEHSVVMIQNWYKPTMCSRQSYRRRGSKTYQTATLTTLNLQTRMRYILAFLPNENERRRKKNIYDPTMSRFSATNPAGNRAEGMYRRRPDVGHARPNLNRSNERQPQREPADGTEGSPTIATSPPPSCWRRRRRGRDSGVFAAEGGAAEGGGGDGWL